MTCRHGSVRPEDEKSAGSSGRLSLKIRHIDAQHEGAERQELLQRGGHAKVPCLKITDRSGNSQWLYDSEKIVAYLRRRFVNV